MKSSRLFIVLAACVFSCRVQATEDSAHQLIGAQKLLEDWRALALTQRSDGQPRSAAKKLREELKNFATTASTLSAADAAEKWLELADRFMQLPAEQLEMEPGAAPWNFSAVLAALPPVHDWPELAAAIEKRPLSQPNPTPPQLAFRLLAARMTDNAAAEKETKDQLIALAKKNSGFEPVFQLAEFFRTEVPEPKNVVENFSRQLEAVEGKDPAQSYSTMRVPDLVTLVGRDRAAPLLRRALLTSVELDFANGRETRELAKSLALEVAAQLKKPRWELASDLGSTDLFEAMEKRFGPSGKSDDPSPFSVENYTSNSDYDRAKAIHMFDLILAGRAPDATALALSFGAKVESYSFNEAMESLADLGREAEVGAFLQQLLSQHPELPLWDSYIEISARVGRSDEALALLKSAATSDKLSKAQRLDLQAHLSQALLADDQVDAGIAELRHTLASTKWMEAVESFIRLGRALKRPELVDEAVAKMRFNWKIAPNRDSYRIASLADLLVNQGRYSDAEFLLNEGIGKALGGGRNAEYELRNLLGELVSVYHRAGRSADVLTLFDKAGYWHATDVAQLGDIGEEPATFFAAKALARTGRNEDAKKVLYYVLDQKNSFDPAYELLLEIGGGSVETKLDELAHRDRFATRPLIWRAEVLRRQGKLAEAEQSVRAAIAIDPSDGEQPHGDRMRSYAVLAEILAGRGDKQQAETYRNVIRAIREAEYADDLHQAGLYKRAIELYGHALGYFSDAYCIQSRLAVQLNDAGRFDEAAEHYQKAYELMPASFGRVESHCFGCERVFGAKRAQTIAEKVFASLAQKKPQVPQVHYLLGYLRREQGRDAEALSSFRRAVQLDPDYLNAWKKIDELKGDMFLTKEERDDVVMAMLRLDPLHYHSDPSLDDLHDIHRLFAFLEQTRAAYSAPPASVYPLPAPDQPAMSGFEQLQYENANSGSHFLTPQEAADNNHLLQFITRLMQRQNTGYSETSL